MLNRIRHGEPVFTLIEMLIVVGIIVALTAVVVPIVIQNVTKGDEGLQNSERSSVRDGILHMMSENELTSVTANSHSTNSWSVANADLGNQALYPGYLEVATTT